MMCLHVQAIFITFVVFMASGVNFCYPPSNIYVIDWPFFLFGSTFVSRLAILLAHIVWCRWDGITLLWWLHCGVYNIVLFPDMHIGCFCLILLCVFCEKNIWIFYHHKIYRKLHRFTTNRLVIQKTMYIRNDS